MFAVIYRNYIKPHQEQEFLAYWKTIATYFVQERGALGSTLHRAEDGMWIAYSRWPNKRTRDASWPKDATEVCSRLPIHIKNAIQGLKNCIDEERRLPEICMEIMEQITLDPFPKKGCNDGSYKD